MAIPGAGADLWAWAEAIYARCVAALGWPEAASHEVVAWALGEGRGEAEAAEIVAGLVAHAVRQGVRDLVARGWADEAIRDEVGGACWDHVAAEEPGRRRASLALVRRATDLTLAEARREAAGPPQLCDPMRTEAAGPPQLCDPMRTDVHEP